MLNLGIEAPEESELSTYSFALAGIARLAGSCHTLEESIRQHLQVAVRRVHSRKGLLAAFREYLKHPCEADEGLLGVAGQFQLTGIEVLCLRLAIAAEEDLLIGHVLTHLQQPLAHSRPTVGLLAQAYAEEENRQAVHVLGQGGAVACGLLQLCGEDLPLPERQVRVPLQNSLALQGRDSHWPGTTIIQTTQRPIPLGKAAEAQAAALAERLCAVAPCRALVIRTGDSFEGRAAAERIGFHCSAHAVLIHTDQVMGLAPWLFLNRLIPVFTQWLAPGERKPIPVVPSFGGPVIVLTGPDGEFESEDRTVIDWRVQIPPRAERYELWQAAIGDDNLAHKVATEHRYTAGRIAALAATLRENAKPDSQITYADISAVARRGDSIGLGALAELIPDEVDEQALVMTEALRQELESLVTRCRLREQFSSSLGPSIQARYRPAVRALFVGPSGTGKTLAAAWLATRLGMPLYRVDLSAITSKYIGETEKNLSQLLTRAEHSEVVLLFDEADALFGKRTDIQDANDRFANAQTNYLLQRMESYDGITVLTSNGRSRFDAAFSRRFDAILSFPLPGPEERRALWSSHLGTQHGVNPEQLNRLAAVAELSGGQIRNAVLRSAVAAAQHGENIFYRHLLAGIASEYRKLSRQLPNELKQTEVGLLG